MVQVVNLARVEPDLDRWAGPVVTAIGVGLAAVLLPLALAAVVIVVAMLGGERPPSAPVPTARTLQR